MSHQVPVLAESYWPADNGEEIRDVTLGELLREAAATVPDRVALVDGAPEPASRRSWTYVQLLESAEQAARALLARFEPGDRIAIWAANSAEWVILQQGIALAGMVTVAVNPAFRVGELEYVFKQSGAAGLFHADSYRAFDMAAAVSEVRPHLPELHDVVSLSDWATFLESAEDAQQLPTISPLDVVQVQYTSGTTGFPKGALLHHKGLVNEAKLVALRAGMGDGGVNINAMPMYHIGGGAVTSMGALAMHGTFVIMHAFDPGVMLELFETYKGTHALVVPTMLIALLDHPECSSRDLSSIQTIMSGASAVPAALVHRAVDTLGCRFSILFGQSEMHGVISQTRVTDNAEDQAETVGQPLAQLEVRIADLVSGESVALGEQGEICCRGYQAMLGYHNMPEETAQTIDADGWVHMGDIGTMDERGFIKVTGRLKEMIIRGGMNIYPREVEETLFTHSAVGDAAVVGVPDEKWGEEVAAVISLKAGAARPSADELKRFCRDRIAAHKAPAYWTFLDTFPMTPSGKVQKFVLRDQISAGDLEVERATKRGAS